MNSLPVRFLEILYYALASDSLPKNFRFSPAASRHFLKPPWRRVGTNKRKNLFSREMEVFNFPNNAIHSARNRQFLLSVLPALIQSNFMAEKPFPRFHKKTDIFHSFEFIFHKDSIFQRFLFEFHLATFLHKIKPRK